MHQLVVHTRLVADLVDDVGQLARVLGGEALAREAQVGPEPLPRPVVGLRPELGERVVHVGGELVVRDVAATVADQPPVVGEQAGDRQLVEGRQHHALGEIARRAVEDEQGRSRTGVVSHAAQLGRCVRGAPPRVGDDGRVAADAIDVEVSGGTIRLGQFLQLAGLVDTGADAKQLIAEGSAMVNGEPELRRGRQLRDGDVVEVSGQCARVALTS